VLVAPAVLLAQLAPPVQWVLKVQLVQKVLLDPKAPLVPRDLQVYLVLLVRRVPQALKVLLALLVQKVPPVQRVLKAPPAQKDHKVLARDPMLQCTSPTHPQQLANWWHPSVFLFIEPNT